MSQVRDPEIKLFGKTITSCVPRYDHHSYSHDDKITSEGEFAQSMHEDDLKNPTADEPVEPETSSGLSDDPKMQDADTETLSQKSMKAEDPNQEKTLKKPDKIIPCPRCNSMETKFCYYNNYNVSQPRHFCKNCQRYWTAGGTMRNVPVGSGRRKNKSSSTSNYRHIMISDALQAARVEAEHGMHLPAFKANGTVLTFGSDKPLCDSMASVLNLDEKSQNCAANGFHGSELRMPANGVGKEFGNDQSSGPCSTASNVTEIGNNSGPHDLAWKKFQAFPPQVPYFPGAPWPCTWDGVQWRSVVPPAAVAPSGFPVSFYPAPPYWGCTVASPWNVPWLSPTPPASDQSAHVSGPASPTLGKHSRDGSMLNPSHSERDDSMQQRDEERRVLIPKTLRIDDPNEAAKSSIWSTLGITNEKYDSVSGARLFKAFNSKADDRNTEADTSLVLQANPAAMSRSFNFQEST